MECDVLALVRREMMKPMNVPSTVTRLLFTVIFAPWLSRAHVMIAASAAKKRIICLETAEPPFARWAMRRVPASKDGGGQKGLPDAANKGVRVLQPV